LLQVFKPSFVAAAIQSTADSPDGGDGVIVAASRPLQLFVGSSPPVSIQFMVF
jgi:hypothetical protein